MMATVAAILDFEQNKFTNFDLQVTQIPPTKFRVNLPFGSGERAQNRLPIAAKVAILDFYSEQF